jgi:aryl-alcohol dehydrogenase-like predicted oxidoreductase
VPAAQALGVGLLPWSPLGRGVLTGKYRGGAPADSRGATEHFQGFVAPYLSEDAAAVVDSVLTAADGLGVSPLAVALAWVRDRPGVVAPVVGARTAAQLQGSLAAERVELPFEIRRALDDVSAPAVDYPEATARWSSPDLED